jgi:ABC-type sugar transport system ATPase subunit
MMKDDLAVDSGFGSCHQPSAEPLTVRALNITKYFGAVRALGNACLSLYPGKVLCSVGDNGAGKSTLSKIVSGQLRPDAGELVDGVPQPHSTTRRALSLGIAVVPQTLALMTT